MGGYSWADGMSERAVTARTLTGEIKALRQAMVLCGVSKDRQEAAAARWASHGLGEAFADLSLWLGGPASLTIKTIVDELLDNDSKA